MTLDEFFKGLPRSQHLFDLVRTKVGALGPFDMRVSKSQIAFRRKRNVLTAWVPSRYLSSQTTAPLVLTFSFPQKEPSSRWKEVVQVTDSRFTHHFEVYTATDLDTEVQGWIETAWNAAG